MRAEFAAFFSLAFVGCSWFGPEDKIDFGDPSEDRAHEFVSQLPRGLGVTRGDCDQSENGEWIAGASYCHGSDG
ncbi:MAG: hypothetical protein AAF564_15675 [Bacteroidota bacterium]